MRLSDFPECKAPSDIAVPEWMVGAFSRFSITFANGKCDRSTRVFWLQSESLTIDLRLPLLNDQLHVVPEDYRDPDTLQQRLNYEGWYAKTRWQDEQLSWFDGTSYQLHNRWPEPARLQRVGDCMMEFAPSGAYVEDWRLLNRQYGPLIGLELESEYYPDSGHTLPRRGALIVCGEYAGLVIGRPGNISVTDEQTLQQWFSDSTTTAEQRRQMLCFETAVGFGNVQQGFRVIHSLDGNRYGDTLFDPDSFSAADEAGYIIQKTQINGRPIERRFRIDCIHHHWRFEPATSCNEEAQQWLRREAATLNRYT